MIKFDFLSPVLAVALGAARKQKRFEERAYAAMIRLELRKRGKLPVDLDRIDAAETDKYCDPYIAEFVSKHTSLSESAFGKLSFTERLPFLKEAAKAGGLFKNNKDRGGRPKSVDVERRRKKVAGMLANGMKPGEIAYKLQVTPETIYQDKKKQKKLK